MSRTVMVSYSIELCDSTGECESLNKCDDCCMVVDCSQCGPCTLHDDVLLGVLGEVPSKSDLPQIGNALYPHGQCENCGFGLTQSFFCTNTDCNESANHYVAW